MRSLFLRIVFLFCALSVNAQAPSIDSLILSYKPAVDSFIQLSKYDEALALQLQQLKLVKKNPSASNKVKLEVNRYLGQIHRLMGNYDQALAILKAAVEFGEANLSEWDQVLASTYNTLGIVYLRKGEYEESEAYFSKSLKIKEEKSFAGIEDIFINLGVIAEQKEKYETAFYYYNKALIITRDIHGKNSLEEANVRYNMGGLFYWMGDLNKSLEHFNATLSIYQENLEPNSGDIAGLLNNMGVVYRNKGDYKKSLEFSDKSLAIYLQILEANHPHLATIYSNIGLDLFEKGDYKKALSYFQKAYDIRLKKLGAEHLDVAKSSNYVGNCYLMMNDFDEAISWLNTALEIRRKRLGEESGAVADSYNDIGYYNEKLGYLTPALEFYKKALKTNIKVRGLQHPMVADAYKRIGEIWLKRGDFPKAKAFFEMALPIISDKRGKAHPDVADLYRNIALCHEEDLSQIQIFCDRGLDILEFDKEDPNNFERVKSPNVLLKILQTKGALLFKNWDKDQNKNHLVKANETYLLALDLIDYIKRTFSESGSKQTLLDNFFQVYEQAIETSRVLHEITGERQYLEQAFSMAERSNGALLVEALRTADAENFSGIPKELLQKERQLKIDIAFYEKLSFEEAQKKELADADKVKSFRDLIFDYKKQHNRLLDTFQQLYPKFYELKYATASVPISKIQSDILTTEQTLLEYFVGDEDIFVFIISRIDFDLVKIPKDFPLEAWVEEFRRSIVGYSPNREDLNFINLKFANIGFELFELIFEPIATYLKNKELIIVPGGILGYLPFDALLTAPPLDKNQFSSHEYLIRQYQISYSYSATLLQETMRTKAKNAPKGLLAFAPKFENEIPATASGLRNVPLGELKYNITEAEAIASILNGTTFCDSSATEFNFVKNADQYAILHLATHGKANDDAGDYSFLAFYHLDDSIENELLFVKDLYNLRLPAEMVVLSACETGIGELQRGEGIISLARGFSFAGAKSIITTLWNIDDRSSYQNMQRFYEYLKKGKTKSAALRQAKMDYLESSNDIKAHPFFWAAYVPVGNMNPIDLEPISWYWWMLGLVGFGVVFYLVRRRFT